MRRENGLSAAAVFAMIEGLLPRLDELRNGLADEVGAGAESLRSLLGALPLAELPTGTVHADLFPDNVLMRGDEVTGLIDFYFACTDHLAYDLGVAMDAWTPAPSDGDLHDQANADAILAGYEAVRPLMLVERECLPALRARAALRFFATRAHDWLHRVPGARVTVKDPLPYARLLRHHLAMAGRG